MEQFKNTGDWWVPDTSEKVSGKVSFAPSEGVVLKLNGSLPYEDSDSERNARADLAKDYPVLYGDLGREGQATLLNATITSANFGSQSGSEGYIAERVILGEHLPQNPSFTKASFVVDEIPTWTNSSTVKPVFETEEVERVIEFDDVETAYVATSPEEYTADFGDVEITLSNYSKTSYMMESVEMETVGVLKIIPDDEVSLSTLYKYGNEALEYLSFAIGTGIYPDKEQLYLESDNRPLDAYHTLPDYTKERPSSKADYLFRPMRVDFERTLQNWVEHYRAVTEVHQNYRLLIHRTNLTPRLRFLTTVIALEALYDSKYESETLIPEDEFDEIQSDILEIVPDDSDLQNQLYGLLENVANHPSIKDKLVRLMESEEEELIETFFDISELAGEARKERNAAAHGSSESSPMEYNLLSKKLQLTLEALLARVIGVPAESLPNALASRHQDLMRLDDFPVSQ